MIERRVPIDGLGDVYLRPLQYGDAVRFYENREPDARMLAGLFRRTLPGFETVTAADVRSMVAGLPPLLEYAIVSASGLLQSDREADALQSDEDDLYEGYDVPEPRAMAPEEGSAQEEAVATLDEFDESDLIDFLYRKGETMESIYRLLMPEIDQIMQGHERTQQRKERQRRKAQRSTTSGETAGPYRKGATDPPQQGLR